MLILIDRGWEGGRGSGFREKRVGGWWCIRIVGGGGGGGGGAQEDLVLCG